MGPPGARAADLPWVVKRRSGPALGSQGTATSRPFPRDRPRGPSSDLSPTPQTCFIALFASHPDEGPGLAFGDCSVHLASLPP